MNQYDNTNRGVLFRNNKKAGDSHPDYKGNVNIDGKEFWISAWAKTPKSGGDTFLSLSIQPKDEQGQGGQSEIDKQDQLPF